MTRIPVMAVDPSLRCTGVALGHVVGDRVSVERLHLIETQATKHKQTRKNSDDLRCAREILDELARLRVEHRPVITMVEVPSGTQSARASWTLGVMLGIIAGLPHPVIELAPVEVKRAFTGDRSASKDTIIKRATGLYPELAWPMHRGQYAKKSEHLADAVAIMHTGAASTAYRELARILTVARVA